MELSEEKKQRLERLSENESLTDNLTDDDARALLKWAEQQILSDVDGELVASAVRSANQSGVKDSNALLAEASAALAQELKLRGINVSRDQPPPSDDLSAAGTGGVSAQTPTAASTVPAPSSLAAAVATSSELVQADLPSSPDTAPRSSDPLLPAAPKKSTKSRKRKKRKSRTK